MFRPRIAGCLFAMGVLTVLAGPAVEQAEAVPALQIYIEGATYNEDKEIESWVLAPADASGGSFRLWTIGDVDGGKSKGLISNVRVIFSYDASYGQIDINLVASTTGGYAGFTDPSTPGTPTFIQYNDTGESPWGGDTRSHSIYGQNTVWQEFALGDFDLTDSPIADFAPGFSGPDTSDWGQINVYEVFVSSPLGSEGVKLHIDLLGDGVFAPFSHDGDGYIGDDDGDVTPVPVPASAWMGIAMLGCLAGGAGLRRFRQQQAA